MNGTKLFKGARAPCIDKLKGWTFPAADQIPVPDLVEETAPQVAESLHQNPLSGDLYIFCGKTRRALKILYWDSNGFCMWQKRIKQDKFPWTLHDEEVKEITEKDLSMLLDWKDFRDEHKVFNTTC